MQKSNPNPADRLPERVVFYIDGFNLYHALNDMRIDKYKWVNLKKLAWLMLGDDQKLISVNFFTAPPNHYKGTGKESRLMRWRAYTAALRAKGITVHEGRFVGRTLRYNRDGFGARWQKHEEKETDVGLAVCVMRDAFLDYFDAAYIVSVDTDMRPVFRELRECFPGKRTVTVAPPRRSHAQALVAEASGLATIRRHHLDRSLFGERVMLGGAVVARRPREYRP